MRAPTASYRHSLHRQRGLVLASSLLLLIVVTIMALSMFRSFGIQERIAGNVREKNRALQAAQTAEQFAETWLANNATSTAAVACTSGLLNANLGQGQICSLASSLASITGAGVTRVPWKASADNQDVGVTFTPSGANATMTVSTSSGLNTYYSAPRFYITDLGVSASGQGEAYQIDAVGYGGATDAVAVVESTFSVYTNSWDPSK